MALVYLVAQSPTVRVGPLSWQTGCPKGHGWQARRWLRSRGTLAAPWLGRRLPSCWRAVSKWGDAKHKFASGYFWWVLPIFSRGLQEGKSLLLPYQGLRGLWWFPAVAFETESLPSKTRPPALRKWGGLLEPRIKFVGPFCNRKDIELEGFGRMGA